MSTAPQQGWWRAVATLVAIALLLVSSAALLHGHAHAATDACVLCQFVHTPVIAAGAVHIVSPPQLTSSLPVAFPPKALALFMSAQADGRAPPFNA